MAIELKQNLRLSTQLLMTPQLQQAIKLLQLSRLELEQYVAKELSENPILEEGLAEGSDDLPASDAQVERTEQQAITDHMASATNIVDRVSGEEKNDADWESYSQAQSQDNYQTTTAAAAARNDDEHPNYENIVTKTKTLQEHLMAQIGELDFNEDERRIAGVLIGNIDERGYLRVTVEEIAQQENVDGEYVEGLLDTIQRMDPPGIAARDLKECLSIQLRLGHLKNGIVEKIVEHHLTELETRNFQAISKALKIPLEVVIESVNIISELEPIPGRQFGNESTQYILPDVYVFQMGENWVVSMNEEGLPRLRVSNVYRNMLVNKEARGDDKNYIQEKLKSATWLIKSIAQRQRTIFKVSECIVEKQRDFFDFGVERLKPMTLKDVAEEISMHESTISRVTNNKYMHTPRGIFELKYFFNSSVSRADGESVASESVKHMIEEIVKGEDAKRPLSDQRIVELLEEKGIQLARRTVAKYREQLNILPSSKRKKYF